MEKVRGVEKWAGALFFFLFSIGFASEVSARPFHYRHWEEQFENQEKAIVEVQGILRRVFSPFALIWESEISDHEGVFEQVLDHLSPQNDPRAVTFQQRYFLNSKYASGPGAPVVFYICGEGTCSSRFVTRYAGELGKQLGAHVVALEHRYYGESQPFAQLTTQNLRFLSTEQAIEDLASFQRYAMTELGLDGKWIAVGGSYPGSLSAYYRLTHPELVVGALASSAPVEARLDFQEYDHHLYQVLPPSCRASVRKVLAAAEAGWGDAEKMARIKRRFHAEILADDLDFLMFVADSVAGEVQYGSWKEFCDRIQAGEDTVSLFADYIRDQLEAVGRSVDAYTPQGAMNIDPAVNDGMRAWTYQTCTQYGYWQTAFHEDSEAMRSRRVNLQYYLDACVRVFGAVLPAADVEGINTRYYRPLMEGQASRIVFTNGQNDPWAELSITHERGNGDQSGAEMITIAGQSHCSDLGRVQASDPEPLKSARSRFLQLAKSWVTQ